MDEYGQLYEYMVRYELWSWKPDKQQLWVKWKFPMIWVLRPLPLLHWLVRARPYHLWQISQIKRNITTPNHNWRANNTDNPTAACLTTAACKAWVMMGHDLMKQAWQDDHWKTKIHSVVALSECTSTTNSRKYIGTSHPPDFPFLCPSNITHRNAKKWLLIPPPWVHPCPSLLWHLHCLIASQLLCQALKHANFVRGGPTNSWKNT